MRFFFVFALEYLLECINGLVRVFFVFVLEYLLECIYDWWGVTSFFFVFYAGLFCEAFHETHRFFHEEFRPRTCSIKFPCKNKNPALSQCKNKNTALSQCNGQKKNSTISVRWPKKQSTISVQWQSILKHKCHTNLSLRFGPTETERPFLDVSA